MYHREVISLNKEIEAACSMYENVTFLKTELRWKDQLENDIHVNRLGKLQVAVRLHVLLKNLENMPSENFHSKNLIYLS